MTNAQRAEGTDFCEVKEWVCAKIVEIQNMEASGVLARQPDGEVRRVPAPEFGDVKRQLLGLLEK